MAALYVMIPAALILVAIAIKIFLWAVDSGQYEDLDSPAHSILFDDEDPMHTAHMHKKTPEDAAPENTVDEQPHA